MTDVKICGLTEPESLTAAIKAGADFLGFVFYPASPRYIAPEAAAYLTHYVPKTVRSVGLFVDPEDAALKTTLAQVRLDVIQLHGQESPGRIAEIKQGFGLPVIKAISIASHADLEKIPGYDVVADWLMFDAAGEDLPGGTGKRFDWSLLSGVQTARPWFLAGGLTPENVGQAMTTLHPDAVDVSSGVESARGIKDPAKIRAFLKAVKQA